MLQLGHDDLRACLDALHAIGEASTGVESFAQRGVASVRRLVASELTTLSVCDLESGRHHVVSDTLDECCGPFLMGHVMAVPIHEDRSTLVRFVANRSGRDFDDRERARLEAIRAHLGDFYRLSRAMDLARERQWAPRSGHAADAALTAREREVMQWLAGGKTDRDIGHILGISPRTVHKHLQRIYEKLGVETRTAAVVRAIGIGAPSPA